MAYDKLLKATAIAEGKKLCTIRVDGKHLKKGSILLECTISDELESKLNMLMLEIWKEHDKKAGK